MNTKAILTIAKAVLAKLKNRKGGKTINIMGIFVATFLFIIVLASTIVSHPVLFAQEAMSENYEEYIKKAKEEISKANSYKNNVILEFLSEITNGEGSDDIPEDELIIIYQVKVGDVENDSEVKESEVKNIVRVILKREGLRLVKRDFYDYYEDARLNLTDEQKVIARQMYEREFIANDVYKPSVYKGGKATLKITIGDRKIKYLSQLDARWAHMIYDHGATIGDEGCGPTSLTMAINILKGENLSPPTIVKLAAQKGQHCDTGGSYWSIVGTVCKEYDIPCQMTHNLDDVKNALLDGKIVMTIMGKGHFTNSGHFMLLREYLPGTNEVLVLDPASSKRTQKAWDINLVDRETKQHTYWILG